MSKVMREIKNVTKGYSSTQIKVREATSNDPWGPTGTQMSEIAQMTFNTSTEFYDIMDMLDKRLNDKGKNWRHVLKALKVLDYCLHEGSELVVTWARQSIYIIKTLREFQYIDEDGRDVGQNVRVAAKEITSLILDEERLRAERSDRKSWKSRVTGLEEHAPPAAEGSSNRRRERRQGNEDDDAEYKLALEASKYQEEEDRKKREGRGNEDDDDDLAKAIKLSQEEEERRRRELEEQNATSLFDLDPTPPAQAQPTGFNQGYQQGNQVDFFANPVEQPMQMQPTGYNMQNFQQPMQTGYQGFGFQQTGMSMDPYGQQSMQQFQPQATGYNPYGQQQMMQQQQQQQQQLQQEPAPQAGSNNPWATNQQQQNLKPMVTGSNNPFAQQAQTARPQTTFNTMSSLTPLPEQKTLSTFSQPAQIQPQQQQMQLQSNMPRREMNEHESKLNALLATGDGLDTYGNAGELRIPAQHTAPGMFMNSAGSGAARLTAEQTGNPYLRQQFTGMPTVSYGAQPGMNGQQVSTNPFGAQQGQKPNQGQDLIQF